MYLLYMEREKFRCLGVASEQVCWVVGASETLVAAGRLPVFAVSSPERRRQLVCVWGAKRRGDSKVERERCLLFLFLCLHFY